MTKADLISAISAETGADKVIVKKVIESFTENVKKSLTNGKNVYLRGFGSFIIVKKAQKTARDIRKNKKVVIPEHYAPKFKPVKSFVDSVKANVK